MFTSSILRPFRLGIIAIASLCGSMAHAAGVSYTSVQGVYNSLCITCHGNAGADAGLNLQSNSWNNTVNKRSGKFGTYRIRPNFATNALSAIYNVVVTQGSSSRHQGGSWTASAAHKTTITDWINQGALQNANPPTVVSLSTTSGGTGGGTSVTVTGTAFGGTGTFVPVVTFGGVAATNVVVTTGSFTTLTCTTPAHAAGAVDVVVTTTTGGASAPLVGGYTYVAGTPAKLAFSTHPSSAGADAIISPAIAVQIQDSAGNPTSSTANVTLTLSANPGASALSGTTTVAAVAGTATFSNISLNRAGTGYTLLATSGGLTNATSNSFNISGVAPTVTSPTSTSVATTSATVGGNVTLDGGINLSARGVVLAPTSINNAPAIGGPGVINVAAAGTTTGVFTVNTASLTPGTQYSFSAYGTNSAGTGYSPVSTFTTISNNANLSALAASAGALSPSFSSGTTSYTLTVPYTTSAVTVTPTTASPVASVAVNGNPVPSGSASTAIPLSVGSNPVTVVVTAQDNSTKTYNVDAVRTAPSANADLANFVTSTGTLSPAFDSAITSYSLSVPYAQDSIQVTPTVADGFSTVSVNGQPVVSGAASSAISLAEGMNTITAVVTAQNANTKAYTLTVTRAAESTSATLASLVPSSGALSPAFHYATTSYTVNVTLETTSITLTPTLSSGLATVQVNGNSVTNNAASQPISLNEGSNLVNVVVTSQDTSNTTTYALTVNRLPSANADLASLTLSSGVLSPVFDSAVTDYSITLPSSTSRISFTPVTANAFATMTLNGTTLASTATSAPVSLIEGDNLVTLLVTAQNGTLKTYRITVQRGFKGAPRIAVQPSSQMVTPGSAVTLSVVAVGADTLIYQWRRNGVLIPNTNSSSYSISSAQTANAGAYTVIVSNSLGSITSDAASIVIAGAGVTGFPVITQQPLYALVKLGQPATFSVTASGAPTLGYQWHKKGAATTLSTITSYTTPPTALTSAGSYFVQVKNTQGQVLSQNARLGMVSGAKSKKVAKIGSPVTLTVSAAGEGLIYQWLKDGVEIGDSTSGAHIITGTQSASLVIKGSTLDDTGDYTCLVRMGALSLESGITTLNIYNLAPIILLADNDGLPTGIVSGPYKDTSGDDYAVPVNASPDRAPASFSVKPALPKGMKLDPVTGVISGKPTVASPIGTPFTVTLTATNGSGSDSATVKLTILPLQTAAVGAFNGLVDRDPSLTSGLSLNAAKTLSFGGSLKVDVLASGVFSGNVTLGAATHKFINQSLDAGINVNPTARVVLPRTAALGNLTLTFAIDKDTGELIGNVTDGTVSANNVHGWHHTAPPTELQGSYTAMLDFTPTQSPDPAGDVAYPQGYCFGTLTVSATSAKWVGTLADATPVTFTTTIGSTGMIPVHLMLYSNTGSLHGWMQISADNATTPTNGGTPLLDGTVDWAKARQPDTSTTHNYKSGFPLHSLTVSGGKYGTPGSPILGLTDNGAGTTNAKLTFSDGGLEGPSPIVAAAGATALNATTFHITSTNTLEMPTGLVDNPATLTLKLNAATGLFSGTCILANDPDPTDLIAPVTMLSRPVKFSGVLVPRLSVNKGVGQFLLSKLPQLAPTKTTLKTSDILSGQVVLGPKL